MVSVVIVNWNGKQYLIDCLPSIINQTCRGFEVIIVDNGSTDGSQSFVVEHYPMIRLIENSENLGFAEANNIGIRESRGDLIITLNNDTKVQPDFIEEMVRVAEYDASVGMVAAKMLNFYNTNIIDSIGIKISRNGLGYNIGSGEEDSGQYDEITEVFGPCAGAALYKKQMLNEVGLFDKDFFAYYEDLDLAWRGRLAGWKCLTAPKAVVLHIHSGTAGKYSRFKTYYIHRNKLWVLIKNWPLSSLLKNLPTMVFYDILATLASFYYLRSIISLKSKIDAIKKIKVMFEKRLTIKELTRTSRKEIEALFAPVESPLTTFLRKIRP